MYTVEGIEFRNAYQVKDLIQERWEQGNSLYPFEVKFNGVMLKSFDELNN